MSESEQIRELQNKKKDDAVSPPTADSENSTGLPVLRDRTGKTVRKPVRIVNFRRKLQLPKIT